MALIERDQQLQALTACLADQLTPGHRSVAPESVTVLTGPVGAGKTTLLQVFAHRCAEAGADMLVASASRSERTVPLEVVRQLVRRAVLADAGRDRIGRLLDEAVLRWGDTTDEEALARLVALVGSELLEIAARGPVVIAVDDVQHADEPSLLCLDYLARRLTGRAAMIVLTEAPLIRPWHPAAYAELLQPARLRRLPVPLLTADGTRKLLADRLGATPARRLADEAHRITGGNPLLVDALAADHATAPAGPVPVPGEAFREAVLGCLYRCERLVLATARLLAVTGEPLASPLLSHLVDLPPISRQRAIDAATSAGLITDGGLRHAEVAQAVLDGMTAAERGQLHRAFAELLHDEGAPTVRIATHLVHIDGLDAPWMVPALLDAGEQALADGDADSARLFLRRANRTGADEPLQARIRSALTRAEWRLDPHAALPHLRDVAAAVRAGHLDSRHAADPIQYLLWLGEVGGAVELIHRLEERTDCDDPYAAADLMTIKGWATALYPGAPICRSHPGRRALDPLTAARVKHRLRGVTLIGTVLDGGDPAVTEDAERLLSSYRLDDETSLWSAVCTVFAMTYANQLDLAAYWSDRLERSASTHRNSPSRALLAAAAATIAGRRGDLVRARALAEEALHRLSPRSWGVAIGAPLAVQLWTLTCLQEWDAAANCLRTPVPPALFETPFGLHYLHSRGLYALASGSPEAALADFRLCGQLMISWGLDQALLVPWRTESARALAMRGRRVEAEKLVQEELSRLRPAEVRSRGLALRVLASVQEGPERVGHLRTAVRLLRQCGDRIELAHALADLGQAQQQDGDLRTARGTARAARDLAEECGLPILRPTPAPGVTGPADLGGDSGAIVTGLTDVESEVAALAAQGHTNREIAARMFLTVSAIEQRLTRIYRKLEVNSRSELTSRLRLGPLTRS